METKKVHYKMYKSGKHFVIAGIVVITMGVGFTMTSTTVQADDASQPNDNQTDAVTSESSPHTKTFIVQTKGVGPTTTQPSEVPTSDKASQANEAPTSDKATQPSEAPTSDKATQPSETPTSDKSTTNVKPQQKLSTSTTGQDKVADTQSGVHVDANSQVVTVDKNNFLDYFTPIGSGAGKYDTATGIQTLTDDSSQSTNASFDGEIDVTKDFTIEGAINLDKQALGANNTIADGIGFVFYNGDRNQVGRSGAGLGIYDIKNAFGWKIDTWQNGDNPNNINGDNDNGHTVPYGAFVTTDANGHGSIDTSTAKDIAAQGTQADDLGHKLEDGQFHDIVFNYTAATQMITVKLTIEAGKVVTFERKFDYDQTEPFYHFGITSSTGGLPTKQTFKMYQMAYSPKDKVIINYVDQNNPENPVTVKTVLLDGSVMKNKGITINDATKDTITDYKNQGYLVVNPVTQNGVTTVSLTHAAASVTPTDDKVPGDAIDASNPAIKWPAEVAPSNLTKTITRTITYVDANGQPIAGVAPVVQKVTYSRTAVVDQVTGQFLGYDTNGDNQADTMDGNQAWLPDGNIDVVTVVSPDLSKQGYNKPSIASVNSQVIDANTASEDIKVEYAPIVVTVTPAKPGQPGKSIDGLNPAIKWPTGTNTDALVKNITRTLVYVDQNGNRIEGIAPIIQTVTYIRDAQVNLVTGEVTYTAWVAKDSDTWKALVLPQLSGYTSVTNSLSEVKVAPTEQSKIVNIVYTKNVVVNNNPNPETIVTPDKKSDTNEVQVPAQVQVTQTVKKQAHAPKQQANSQVTLPETDMQTGNKGMIAGVVLGFVTMLGGVLGLRKKHEQD